MVEYFHAHDYCSYSYYLQDSYRYRCSTCSRSFIHRCDLKRHLQIHAGDFPHRCNVCGKGKINHRLTFCTRRNIMAVSILSFVMNNYLLAILSFSRNSEEI